MSRYCGAGPTPEFVRVAGVADVPAGGMLRVDVDGRDVALVNLDGTFYAVDNNCPHNGGPLTQGQFRSDRAQLVCPWHAWSWDVRTGRAVSPPVGYRVLCYEVRLEGPDILVSRSPQ